MKNHIIFSIFTGVVLLNSILLKLLPNFRPHDSDVVGGFTLYNYPNLKYLAIWMFNAVVVTVTSAYLLHRYQAKTPRTHYIDTKIRNKLISQNEKEKFVEKIYFWLSNTAFIIIILILYNIILAQKTSNWPSLLQAINISRVFFFEQFKWLLLIGLIIIFTNLKVYSEKRLKYIDIIGNLSPLLGLWILYTAAYGPFMKINPENGKEPLLLILPSLAIFWTLITIKLKPLGTSGYLNKFLFIIFPALLVVVLAHLPSAMNPSNLHGFESFGFANLFSHREYGYLPWKDLITNHGAYEDFVRFLIASFFGGSTLWGTNAALTLIISPLEFLIAYYLLIQIFGKKIEVVFFVLCSLFTTWFFLPSQTISSIWLSSFPRMLPMLLVIALVIRVIKKNSASNWIYLSLAYMTALIVSEESLYIIVAVVVSLFIYDLSQRNTHAKIYLSFSNTAKALMSAIIGIVSIIIIMSFFGLSKSYIASFFQGSDGFLLQGGMNINWNLGANFALSLVLIVSTILGIITRAIYSLFDNETIPADYLAILISTFVGAAFFCKFLLWPDWHLGQVLATLFPVWYFLLSKLIGTALNNRDVLVATFVLFIVFTGSQVQSNLSLNNQYVKQSSLISIDQKYGFIDDNFAEKIKRTKDLKKSINQIAGVQNPLVLDLTNSPTIVHYLAEYKPIPKTTFIATIFSTKQQIAAIERIKASNPDVVLWGGEEGYFESVLPGGVVLRNFLIVQYVLDNYSVGGRNGDYIILKRNTIDRNPDLDSVNELMQSRICDWRDGMNYLSLNLRYSRVEAFGDSVNGLPGNRVLFENAHLDKISSLEVEISGKGYMYVQRSKSSGFIKFFLDADTKNNFYLPLGNCPSWNYSGADTKAEVKTDGTLEIKKMLFYLKK